MDTPLKVDKALWKIPFSTFPLSLIYAIKVSSESVVTTYDKVTPDSSVCLFCDTLISLTVPQPYKREDTTWSTAAENDAVDACSNVTPDSTW